MEHHLPCLVDRVSSKKNKKQPTSVTLKLESKTSLLSMVTRAETHTPAQFQVGQPKASSDCSRAYLMSFSSMTFS